MNIIEKGQFTEVDYPITNQHYGIKMIYVEIDTILPDTCFSNNTKTHSVY